MKDEVLRRLASNPEERRTLEQQIRTVFEVHAGIETSAMEEGVLRRTVNPVAPCKRELIDRPDAQGAPQGPRRNDFVYDVPVNHEPELEPEPEAEL